MLGFCWHKWSSWGEPFQYGFSYYQDRYCLKCNRHDSIPVRHFDEKDERKPEQPDQGTSGKSVIPNGGRCCRDSGGNKQKKRPVNPGLFLIRTVSKSRELM